MIGEFVFFIILTVLYIVIFFAKRIIFVYINERR
jgi:hypothetical protein